MLITGHHRLQMIALLSLWLTVLSSFSSYTSAESRLALVIGNGAYSKEAKLKTPPNDAQLMADTLRVLNFELFGGRVYVNVTQEQIRRLIWDFTQQLDRQSVGLFYYSGHGMQVDNRNYMLPVDTEIKDTIDIRVQGVSVDEEVLWRMSNAKPIISIILLDACRDNPFEKRVKSLGGSKGLGDMSPMHGSIIGFASEPNTVAYESKGNYSYFTEALAREIVQPGIDITQVLRRVRVAVRTATNGKQVPTTRDVLFDDFYLLRNLRNLPPVPELSVPTSGITNQLLSFSAVGSSDPDGTITSYQWDYGDGTTANFTFPRTTYRYESPGTYMVQLMIEDDKGATATASQQVPISEEQTMSLGADVLFDFDKAELRPAGIAQLAPLLQAMQEDLLLAAMIVGHTDSIGPEEHNLGLSQRRAQAVAHYLMDGGISADRLKVEGRGETEPRDINHTKEGRKQNRRIEVIISGTGTRKQPRALPNPGRSRR